MAYGPFNAGLDCENIPVEPMKAEEYEALTEKEKNAEVVYAITDDYDGIPVDTAPTAGSTNMVTSGGVYEALERKAPTGTGTNGAITTADLTGILPMIKGGTGGSNVWSARANLGITVNVNVPVSGSLQIKFKTGGTYILSTCDSRRAGGVVLIQTGDNAQVVKATDLIDPNNWSYTYSGTTFTLNNADANYAASISVTTLGHSNYSTSGPYLGG